MLRRPLHNIPTESILFNYRHRGTINKDKTAVLRVFAKVFYNHLGFYGEDLKIAKLERFVICRERPRRFVSVRIYQWFTMA
jgi:hypothetical protein